MKVDHNKVHKLVDRDVPSFSADALRREENVFLVGGNLPERETLETLFESHYQCNASLFHLTFGDLDNFQNGENLARVIKKNFNTHLVGRLEYPAPRQLIERAYAAGVDIIDLPLKSYHRAGSQRGGAAVDELLRALETARSVFPRWSVVSTLVAGLESSSSTIAGIDALLAAEVLPLVTLSGHAARLSAAEVSKIFTHLNAEWRARKALIKPLLPLIQICTPLVPASSPGLIRGFIDSIEDRRLLAASDLRRVLRVKEVAQSFDSAGL